MDGTRDGRPDSPVSPVLFPVPSTQFPGAIHRPVSGAIHPGGLRFGSCLSISVEFGLAGIRSSTGAWHLGDLEWWWVANVWGLRGGMFGGFC